MPNPQLRHIKRNEIMYQIGELFSSGKQSSITFLQFRQESITPLNKLQLRQVVNKLPNKAITSIKRPNKQKRNKREICNILGTPSAKETSNRLPIRMWTECPSLIHAQSTNSQIFKVWRKMKALQHFGIIQRNKLCIGFLAHKLVCSSPQQETQSLLNNIAITA